MRYILNETISVRLPHVDEAGKHILLELSTGQKLYEVMVTKTEDLTSIEQAVLTDFYKKIDPRYTGDCQVPEGEYIELTDPQHDLLCKRLDAKIRWFGNIDHPVIFRLIRDMREAPTKRPKAPLKLEPSNGKAEIEPEAVEA